MALDGIAATAISYSKLMSPVKLTELTVLLSLLDYFLHIFALQLAQKPETLDQVTIVLGAARIIIVRCHYCLIQQSSLPALVMTLFLVQVFLEPHLYTFLQSVDLILISFFG